LRKRRGWCACGAACLQIMVDAEAGTIRAYDLNAAKRMLTHAVNGVVCGDAAAAVGRTRAESESAGSGGQSSGQQRNGRTITAKGVSKKDQQTQRRRLPLKRRDKSPTPTAQPVAAAAAAAAAVAAAAKASASVAAAAAAAAAVTSVPPTVGAQGALALSKEEALVRFQARKATLAAKAAAAAAASVRDAAGAAGAAAGSGVGAKRVVAPQACRSGKPRPCNTAENASAGRKKLQSSLKPKAILKKNSDGAAAALAAAAAVAAAAASAGGNSGAVKGAHGRAGGARKRSRAIPRGKRRRASAGDGRGLAVSALRGLGM
jgi:hypothetical protein